MSLRPLASQRFRFSGLNAARIVSASMSSWSKTPVMLGTVKPVTNHTILTLSLRPTKAKDCIKDGALSISKNCSAWSSGIPHVRDKASGVAIPTADMAARNLSLSVFMPDTLGDCLVSVNFKRRGMCSTAHNTTSPDFGTTGESMTSHYPTVKPGNFGVRCLQVAHLFPSPVAPDHRRFFTSNHVATISGICFF
jgi:hypothetical protein